MLDIQSHVVLCGDCGVQPVRDHDVRRKAQSSSAACASSVARLSISASLDENIEDEAILIDGAPQPMFSSRDGDDDLVHAPLVSAPTRATEPLRLFAAALVIWGHAYPTPAVSRRAPSATACRRSA